MDDSEKPKRNWLMRSVVIISLILVAGYYSYYSLATRWKPLPSCCGYTESIARNIEAHIADYWSHPNNTDLPSFEKFQEYAETTFADENFKYSALIKGTVDNPVITVWPDPKSCQCSFGVLYEHYFYKPELDSWFDASGNRHVR